MYAFQLDAFQNNAFQTYADAIPTCRAVVTFSTNATMVSASDKLVASTPNMVGVNVNSRETITWTAYFIGARGFPVKPANPTVTITYAPRFLDLDTITLPLTFVNGVWTLVWPIPPSRSPSNVKWTLQSDVPISSTSGSFSILW